MKWPMKLSAITSSSTERDRRERARARGPYRELAAGRHHSLRGAGQSCRAINVSRNGEPATRSTRAKKQRRTSLGAGPSVAQQNPIRFAKNFRTPIMLSVGENDFRVP